MRVNKVMTLTALNMQKLTSELDPSLGYAFKLKGRKKIVFDLERARKQTDRTQSMHARFMQRFMKYDQVKSANNSLKGSFTVF